MKQWDLATIELRKRTLVRYHWAKTWCWKKKKLENFIVRQAMFRLLHLNLRICNFWIIVFLVHATTVLVKPKLFMQWPLMYSMQNTLLFDKISSFLILLNIPRFKHCGFKDLFLTYNFPISEFSFSSEHSYHRFHGIIVLLCSNLY